MYNARNLRFFRYKIPALLSLFASFFLLFKAPDRKIKMEPWLLTVFIFLLYKMIQKNLENLKQV